MSSDDHGYSISLCISIWIVDFSSSSFPALKMFGAMLRAVATGTPSARCPPVMHVYTFEHGAQFLLYGEYLNSIKFGSLLF